MNFFSEREGSAASAGSHLALPHVSRRVCHALTSLDSHTALVKILAFINSQSPIVICRQFSNVPHSQFWSRRH